MTVPDLQHKTEKELRQLIENYEKKGRGDEPLCQEARRLLSARVLGGLTVAGALPVILQAAKDGRFIDYGTVAAACGVPWNKAYRQMGVLLGEVVNHATGKGWPMLSAIVVNRPNLKTGKMNPATLAGFIAKARELEADIGDEAAFLEKEQQMVFAWGRSQA